MAGELAVMGAVLPKGDIPGNLDSSNTRQQHALLKRAAGTIYQLIPADIWYYDIQFGVYLFRCDTNSVIFFLVIPSKNWIE